MSAVNPYDGISYGFFSGRTAEIRDDNPLHKIGTSVQFRWGNYKGKIVAYNPAPAGTLYGMDRYPYIVEWVNFPTGITMEVYGNSSLLVEGDDGWKKE